MDVEGWKKPFIFDVKVDTDPVSAEGIGWPRWKSNAAINTAVEKSEFLKIEKSRVLAQAKGTLKAARESSAAVKLYEADHKKLLYHTSNEPAAIKAIVT